MCIIGWTKAQTLSNYKLTLIAIGSKVHTHIVYYIEAYVWIRTKRITIKRNKRYSFNSNNTKTIATPDGHLFNVTLQLTATVTINAIIISANKFLCALNFNAIEIMKQNIYRA